MVQRRLNWLIFTVLIWPYYWLRMYAWWPLRKKAENRIADIGRLIDLRPDYAPFYLRRASWLAQAGQQIGQGFADCEKARQINPALDNAPQIHRIRAHLHWRNNAVDKAIAQLDRTLQIDHSDRGSYFFRAYLHYTQGRFAQAIADYRQGLKHDFGMNRTQYADIYTRTAETYLEMGETQKALDALDKAAQYSPQNSDIVQLRVYAYAIREDLEAINAQISAIPAHQAEQLGHALSARGQVYLMKGLPAQAMDDFGQALTMHECWVMYLNRGMGYLHLGDHAAAMRDLQQSVQLAPEVAPPHNGLGFLALIQGDLEAARASINRALELRPAMAEAHDSRGHLHLLSGDYAAALQAFDTAVSSYPQESTRLSAMAGQAVAHYALADADSIDTAVAQWRALCERYDDRDLRVYLRERMVWPSRSLELAEQLNALTFP